MLLSQLASEEYVVLFLGTVSEQQGNVVALFEQNFEFFVRVRFHHCHDVVAVAQNRIRSNAEDPADRRLDTFRCRRMDRRKESLGLCGVRPTNGESSSFRLKRLFLLDRSKFLRFQRDIRAATGMYLRR